MAAIVWSEMMTVGVPILDADHKTLVGLINHLHRSVGDSEEYAILGSVLRALEEYSDHHFAREERVMEVCEYPALDLHTQMHRRLATHVRDLRCRYDTDRISNRDAALAAGADEFLEKPISARALLICLARLLRKDEGA